MTIPSIRRVLCAVDVARPALPALHRARVIADRFQADLEALYARDRPVPLGFLPAARKVESLVAHWDAEARLKHVLRTEGGSARASGHLIDGQPLSTILAHSALTGADLIVLGWNSLPAPVQSLRPSVARRVAAQARCAVLTVRNEVSGDDTRRILLPVDFSSATPPALCWAVAFARRFRAQVHVVHAPRTAGPTGSASLVETRALLALRETEARLRHSGVMVSSELLPGGDASQALLERGAGAAFDLAIMGMHRAVSHEGSEQDGTISTFRDHARIPVLSVRPELDQVLFADRGSQNTLVMGASAHVGTA